MADLSGKPKFSERVSFFNTDLKSEEQQKLFENIYNKNSGNWSAVKSDLSKENCFTPELITKLEFTHKLSEWSSDNKELISDFQKDINTNSLRDIALGFNKTEFIGRVKGNAPGASDEEKEKNALTLRRRLFNAEPTAMLVNMIKDPAVPVLNDPVGANVAAVLEEHPDFNIKTASVYDIIKDEQALKNIPPENHNEVKKQLKLLQRITAISPDSDAVPVLYNAGLHSALQISGMSLKQLKQTLGPSGLDNSTLEQIHLNSSEACLRNEQTLMALKEAGRGSGVAMIDNSLNMTASSNRERDSIKKQFNRDIHFNLLKEILGKHNISWDLIFGDADFCECGECNSVYSPASYFVGLLQYLRNNNLDPDAQDPAVIKKNNPKDISGTPLEKLLNRRPDLGCLELTCKNTNTVLPYIDLVNEVMENYVASKHLKPFNVEDETSSELLSEPQHTEYKAYCILKNEVYPFTLPYNQPVDAARIYLRHLDTSRYELIKTFRKNNACDDALLAELKDEEINRAADAEYLGLTKEEYIILTKECFKSKALMDKLKNKTHTDDEYHQTIGIKPVCRYYGYDNDALMQGDDGLKLIKKEFLRRTGIDYVSLVDLLKTGYINPNVPKGKTKVIMESLRFSYRFLQFYAAVFGIDKMAEDLVKMEAFADLVPKVKDIIELLTGRNALSCPKPDSDTLEVTDKDIVHWVKCHFEKIGKMIVIESGRGCVNGNILTKLAPNMTANVAADNYRVKYSVKDCKISNNGTEIGSIDPKTGELKLNEPQPFTNPAAAIVPDILFIGDQGEKGIFLAFNNKAYLVFVETRDSCDLDTALLQHLDGTPLDVEEYDRIHRFIRLWRKLGWTINETDQAIMGLGCLKSPAGQPEESLSEECGPDDCSDTNCDECEEDADVKYDINTGLIHQLAAVKKLIEKTDLEVIKLLSFWSNISTFGEKSLYVKLFLTHNVLGIDKVFKADDKGNYLTSDAELTGHLPAVSAALNLSEDDIQEIMKAGQMEDKLTLKNLSFLYRYRLLSKTLGLKIPAFISILPLFGNVFEDAIASYKLIKNWEKIEQAGFTYQQLNYIIAGKDNEKKPFTPTQKKILQISKTLYDGLNLIDEMHKDLKADDSITDPLQQKINIEQKASGALVRTKTSLLFESAAVEKIAGLLEGTNVFTTNAPKGLKLTWPALSTLQNKLKYNAGQGVIQVTGILTETETAEYKTLTTAAEWTAALERIKKQQKKLFKELLSGIFENEKTKTDTEKEQLKAVIEARDIIIPPDKIPEGQADTNTAPKKRAAFLEIFLPYLRQQLMHRFVIDTLSGFCGLDAKLTDVLVSEILMTDKPLYSIFEKIKDSSKPGLSNWSGYVIPQDDNDYTFIIKNSDNPPVMNIDGAALTFTAQEDPTNEWWSDTVKLQAGKLYKLEAPVTEINNIFWKIPASEITAVPSSSLIPDFASKDCEPALIALKKASMLVSVFTLGAEEIRFINLHKTDFDNLDFNSITFAHWLRLEAYTRLRNYLPQAKLNILDFWKWTNDSSSDMTMISGKIADLTMWKKERIEKLIAADHFNISRLEDYRNEKNLLKLQRALSAADKTGADINSLFTWAVPASKFDKCRKTADSIKNLIRSRYNQTDWEKVVKPLHDELRNNQKNALIAYLLQQKELIAWNVKDADGLFEYFLIDVQMEPAVETSRIKQAISSVQLFIQRCFLGLEIEHSSIGPEVLDRERWEWMQRYRVWEANRKVFLYPENWIESNLRDDKSPFYKELESELLQKDINKQNVSDALKAYLYKLDDVSNMEVVGFYIESETDKDGMQTDKPVKLHIVSRTRNAPYFFYYRFYDMKERDWYPWEKMQVDIPGYDVIKQPYISTGQITNQISDNGSYVTPVVWNGRLFVFFPQIMKKTVPAQNANVIKIPPENSSITLQTSIEFYEIKMAWTEYRNRKWTQKQVSKGAVYSSIIGNTNNIPDIQFFKFVPIVERDCIKIDVDYDKDNDGTFKGAFNFDGSSLKSNNPNTDSVKNTEPIPIDYFNQSDEKDGKMYSWQLNPVTLTRVNKTIYFQETGSKEELQGLNTKQVEFNYPYTQSLLGSINTMKPKGFFRKNLDMDKCYFGPISEDGDEDIYNELKHPYSLYNWELFFHTPMLLADSLSKAQQFEEAMKWFHFVFDPLADGDDDKRFWQFKPFREIESRQILESIFNNLKPNTENDAINEWRNKPFMPHVVARSRPVAYMKWVVMKYIDNLLSWGDYLFRQDTIETINQAAQLYVLAGHILGPKPMMIPKRGKIRPQTYLSLLDKWDAFDNAMTELEHIAPFSSQTVLPAGMVNGEIALANIFGLASSLYFCIPNNPKLMGYWDTIADRLFKIRHSMNIEGVFRKLPLFEPPIDPALLVKAAAQGLSIASVLNDLNTPMPNYRFYYLLQKALELCNELKSLGNALLSAIEKKDNEAISCIRAKHESAMQNLIMEIKKKQLEEAQKNLESLLQNRKAPEARMKYYLKLSGKEESLVPDNSTEFSEIQNDIVTVDGESGLKLIAFEKEDMDKAGEAREFQIGIGATETFASIMHVIPSFQTDAEPFGIGMTSTVTAGWMLGNAAQAVARGLQIYAADLTYQSTNAGKKGTFQRVLQERIFQANAAGFELKQIDKQITSQEIRISIANQEITNQQKAIDNASEVEDFLKNKYSNEELYTWMRDSLKTLYHQVYNLAYELAKKAEKTFCFERGISSANYIQPGYFDAGRDGLLAGENLYVGLKQLEAAYQNERGYDYEITKHISLYQLNPYSILQLRETGECEFILPEFLFDMDFPGHFKRRIKSVSISIPCIAGPYTGINAALRLLENKFRNTAIGGKSYGENTEEEDQRFSSFIVPINAIAASSAQNDSGLIELNFKDERYLPFEGAGVISKWRLELPSIRKYDYGTISDVIIHLRYVSSEGGERLKAEAEKYTLSLFKNIEQELDQTGINVALDMKHDMSDKWQQLQKNGSVKIQIDISRLPYVAQSFNLKKVKVIFIVKLNSNLIGNLVKIDGDELNLTEVTGLEKFYCSQSQDINLNSTIELSVTAQQLSKIEEFILLMNYSK